MKINLTNVNYLYNQGTATEKYAVMDVTLSVEKTEFIAIVGSTGSGKSTLIQLLNGLKLPTSGTITRALLVMIDSPSEQTLSQAANS